MTAKRTLFNSPSTPSAKRTKPNPMGPKFSGATPELKYLSTVITATNTGDNLTSLITSGTGRGNRVGDTIRVKKVMVHGNALVGAVHKAYLYSRNGNAPVTLPDAQTYSQPDPKEYRVWDHVNQKMALANINPAGGLSDYGPGLILKKTFGIPMKVTYEETTNTQENGIYLLSRKIDYDSNSSLPSNLSALVQVWYYDA